VKSDYCPSFAWNSEPYKHQTTRHYSPEDCTPRCSIRLPSPRFGWPCLVQKIEFIGSFLKLSEHCEGRAGSGGATLALQVYVAEGKTHDNLEMAESAMWGSVTTFARNVESYGRSASCHIKRASKWREWSWFSDTSDYITSSLLQTVNYTQGRPERLYKGHQRADLSLSFLYLSVMSSVSLRALRRPCLFSHFSAVHEL
jgi:hypothetical protein